MINKTEFVKVVKSQRAQLVDEVEDESETEADGS